MIRFIFLILTLTSLSIFAETEHEKHHPKGPPGQGAGGPGGMAAGMGEMMKSMGVPPRKEFYPSLMEMPQISTDAKTKLNEQAHERMKTGAIKIDQGLKRLTELAGGEDFQAMKAATNEMREGLAEFDSGIATQQALKEGKPPRDIALKWFKDSMSISEPQEDQNQVSQLSVFHLFVMGLLTVFMIVMVVLYFKKMRRASELVAKLQSQNNPPSTPPQSAPPISSSHAPPTTPSSTPVQTKNLRWKGRLKVATIYNETSSVKTFKLISPDTGELPFTYEAGQFLNLSVVVEGKPLNRAYSISSHPCDRKTLEITIKREEHGLVSRYMHDVVREGDFIDIEAAYGNLTFSGLGDRSIVLLGGGVGITPLMSVLRCIISCGMKNNIYLLYSCRTLSDFVFRDEIEFLQKRNSNLKVFLALDKLESPYPGAIEGRLTKEKIRDSVPDLKSARVHLCGPPPMMEAMRTILNELSVPQDQVKTEAFGPAKKNPTPSSGVVSVPNPVRDSALAPQVAQNNKKVSFVTSKKDVSSDGSETVLEVAEKTGIDIPFSCRTGTCGTCKIKLLSGQVKMPVQDGLSDDDKKQNFVLACQALPLSNISIEA